MNTHRHRPHPGSKEEEVEHQPCQCHPAVATRTPVVGPDQASRGAIAAQRARVRRTQWIAWIHQKTSSVQLWSTAHPHRPLQTIEQYRLTATFLVETESAHLRLQAVIAAVDSRADRLVGRVEGNRRRVVLRQLKAHAEKEQREDDAKEAGEDERPPTEALHQGQSEEGEEKVDRGGGRRQPDGGALVVDAAHLNDGGAVVHDGVDARQLLEGHQQTADQ